jgi:hypothetical protein
MIAPQMAVRAFRTAPKVAPWAKLSAQLPRAQPAFRRFFAAAPQEQPRLRLGSTGMFEIRSQLHLSTEWVKDRKLTPMFCSSQFQGIDHQGRD